MISIAQTVLIYTISSSVLMVYGFGLERSYFESHPASRFYARIPTVAGVVVSTVAVMWYPVSHILVPFGYAFLSPVLLLLAYGTISNLFSLVTPSMTDSPSGERVFLFGTAYLALFESTSLFDAIAIAASGVIAFSLVTTLLFSVRERIAPTSIRPEWRGAPIILVTMGLLALAFYGADVSWWLSGGPR